MRNKHIHASACSRFTFSRIYIQRVHFDVHMYRRVHQSPVGACGCSNQRNAWRTSGPEKSRLVQAIQPLLASSPARTRATEFRESVEQQRRCIRIPPRKFRGSLARETWRESIGPTGKYRSQLLSGGHSPLRSSPLQAARSDRSFDRELIMLRVELRLIV